MARFTVTTFGCQMNQHDSERLSEVLRAAGYSDADGLDDATLIVLNTCSVRDKAEHKLRSEVGRLAMLKEQRPELVLAVAGCVAQQEGERLLKSMPAVDVIVGPDNLRELPELLRDVEHGRRRVSTVFDTETPHFLAAEPVVGGGKVTAFVTTMKGCNERCSFCIVPATRGPERYRPSTEILDEVTRWVEAGVREITLLGQTVNSYRDPERRLANPPSTAFDALDAQWKKVRRADGDDSEFPALLRAIAAATPKLRRLRYTSPHPRHLTPALAQAHADLPVLARHVHMPVQSGSDRVLKRMIRRYTVDEYVERVTMLRDAVPGLSLSTDVIVGFPGETREDFEATLALMRRVGYSGVFAFKYSERPQTPSQKLDDDVSEDEKSARLAELIELVDGTRQAHLAHLVGTFQSVLVEGQGKSGAYTGRTERNEIVHFDASPEQLGEIVDVRIVRAFKNSLSGELERKKLRLPLAFANAPRARRNLPVM
ncbi:MAG TPA: tRNA (N6-isopentenyl adenosine(37)-C2)-methylthiotransferase MiaB [Polyangiaceae bacterium]|jgi:tRNA-2-methylthio-N6-dimethylallyladenosine synthase|nr:tRNA (N6-isopentenyl adenosine(37)-C2)-methylthiotransferase MiaB [Polyangiaceae bacterium]